MDSKTKKDWDKFLDSKNIKKNLIDAALFLTFYEILKNEIIEKIASFYSHEFRDGKWITSQEYKERIIDRIIDKRPNIFLSSCYWLIENDVITKEDLTKIEELRDLRNRIAHDLPKFLFDSEYEINKKHFAEIKDLTLKIAKWWIINVDIATDPDFDDSEIDYNNIKPGQVILLNYIFNIANTDFAELERLLNKSLEN